MTYAALVTNSRETYDEERISKPWATGKIEVSEAARDAYLSSSLGARTSMSLMANNPDNKTWTDRQNNIEDLCIERPPIGAVVSTWTSDAAKEIK